MKGLYFVKRLDLEITKKIVPIAVLMTPTKEEPMRSSPPSKVCLFQ